MTNDRNKDQPRTGTLKNETARQRWDLFHQAIAHAKKANNSTLTSVTDEDSLRPVPCENLAS
ncbi:MAG: hypothetical protein KJO19_00440 [Woeseia sp.]|nr:hypothetical protein [Woeseia sp.]